MPPHAARLLTERRNVQARGDWLSLDPPRSLREVTPNPIDGFLRFGSSAQILRRIQPAGLLGSGTQSMARS